MVSYIELSDSDEENYMKGIADEESHYSGPKENEGPVREDEEEEDPEELPEEEPARIVEITPLPPVPSTHKDKKTRSTKTARMSVIPPRSNGITIREPQEPTPIEQGGYFTPSKLDQPPLPDSDPYERYNNPKWDNLPKYLREWRRDMHFPAPSLGETSNARQLYPLTHEPPHHTTPLLAAIAHNHERRLDQLDIMMMEMPGYQEYEQVSQNVHAIGIKTTELNNQVLAMGHQLGIYQQATNNLMDKEIMYTNYMMVTSDHLARTMDEVDVLRTRRVAEERRMAELERRQGEMERRMHQFDTAMRQWQAYIHAWDIIPNEHHGN